MEPDARELLESFRDDMEAELTDTLAALSTAIGAGDAEGVVYFRQEVLWLRGLLAGLQDGLTQIDPARARADRVQVRRLALEFGSMADALGELTAILGPPGKARCTLCAGEAPLVFQCPDCQGGWLARREVP